METTSCYIFEFESSKFVSEILLSVLWEISITLCLSIMQSLSRFKVERLFGVVLVVLLQGLFTVTPSTPSCGPSFS